MRLTVNHKALYEIRTMAEHQWPDTEATDTLAGAGLYIMQENCMASFKNTILKFKNGLFLVRFSLFSGSIKCLTYCSSPAKTQAL